MLPYYKIITVPDLTQITQELDQALPELVTGQFDLKAVYSFNIIDVTKLLDLTPTLATWLDTVGLKNNLWLAGFPWAAPASVGALHIDGNSAINFPVYNCERGYSVWYRAYPSGENKLSTSGKSVDLTSPRYGTHRGEYMPCLLTQRRHLTRVMHDNGPELARVSNQYPIWFNTSIPHCGINFSDQPRIIFTMRFDCPLDVDAL